jgi:hypothetical protein
MLWVASQVTPQRTFAEKAFQQKITKEDTSTDAENKEVAYLQILSATVPSTAALDLPLFIEKIQTSYRIPQIESIPVRLVHEPHYLMLLLFRRILPNKAP